MSDCPMWRSTNPLDLLALLVQREFKTQSDNQHLILSTWKHTPVYTNTPSVWTLGSLIGTDNLSLPLTKRCMHIDRNGQETVCSLYTFA